MVSSTAVPGVTGMDGVACSYTTTCAWGQGKVLCWGSNSSGQLGDPNKPLAVFSTEVATVQGLPGTKVTQVITGDETACALLETGDVYCWGSNALGQAGLDNLSDSALPQQVKGLP